MRYGKPFISSPRKYLHGKTGARRCPTFNPSFCDRYVYDCFSKKKKKTTLMIYLSASTFTILTSFLLSKKILTISSAFFSLMLTSSTEKSTRNKENHQRIENQKSLPNGKEIVLLARGTQREYSSKPLKHSIVKRISAFKR